MAPYFMVIRAPLQHTPPPNLTTAACQQSNQQSHNTYTTMATHCQSPAAPPPGSASTLERTNQPNRSRLAPFLKKFELSIVKYKTPRSLLPACHQPETPRRSDCPPAFFKLQLPSTNCGPKARQRFSNALGSGKLLAATPACRQQRSIIGDI